MNIRDSAVETLEALRESRRKDGFLATLCHQLRNQLAPIRHAVYLLKLHERGTENPVQQQAHEIIQRQLANMTKLISDLEEVSRVVNGQIGLNPQVVDLNQIVAHAVETVKPLAEQRRHTLKLVLNPTPVWTNADPGRLEEVFINLVDNAAKYTAAGGKVVVTCHHLRGSNHSEVRVRDNGVGIEKKLLPNIFDLFSESDQSLHRAASGLGIGLTVAHRLVELHGGTIEVHSPPANAESGSEFIVRLSVAGPPLLQLEQGSRTVSQEAHRGRVLIIDDNADMVAMLSSTLIHRGYAVQFAHTGPDGLLMAEQCQPDVIVLDIGLPGLNGYELARRLRASPNLRKARIIALMGYGQEADIQLALDADFDAHMVKPYDYEELEKLMFPELKMNEMDPQLPSADIADPNAGTFPLKSLPMPALRVLCVDDDLHISHMLRMLIDGAQGMQCVGCLASADTLLVEAERLSPDVVIIDLSMPGKDALEAIGELGTASPLVRTIVFSASNNRVVPRSVNILGASGWLSKNEKPEIIVQAIRDVAAGKSFFPTGSSNF